MHSIEKQMEIAICNKYLEIVFAQADEQNTHTQTAEGAEKSRRQLKDLQHYENKWSDYT